MLVWCIVFKKRFENGTSNTCQPLVSYIDDIIYNLDPNNVYIFVPIRELWPTYGTFTVVFLLNLV